MAYAELAGLPAVAGLYALLLPTVAYAFLGSSRQLIVGPEGSLSALVAAAVLALATAGSPEALELAGAMALLVAACFLIARVLRLGWLADYLSRPVLVGYIHGVAVVLIVGQLGKLTGVDIPAGDPLPQLVELVRGITDVNATTFAVGATALVLLLAARSVSPRLPAALATLIASSSWSARMCWPWRPANERAVSISSANETRNSPAAAGASVATSVHGGLGIFRSGRPAGISPTTATPCSSSPSAFDATIAPITTTSAAGSRGDTERAASSSTRAVAPTANVVAFTSPMWRTSSTSWGTGSPALMSTPVSFPS